MKPTAFSRGMGVELPLMLAPMAGGPSTPALAVAVCEAGALGALGGQYLPPDKLRAEIREVRAGTSRPFAVNLFADDGLDAGPQLVAAASRSLQRYRDELGLKSASQAARAIPLAESFAVLLEERVPAFSFTFGIPPPSMLQACRERGIATMGTATCVAEAKALDEAGVDFICAQGAEAGGHRGTFDGAADPPLVGTLALVPQVVSAVRVPVIAAGGIMDGRGVVAALALGAAGASLGTAFLRCPEAGTSAPYREALREARDDATTITRAFSGRPARGLANRFTREMASATLAPYPVQNGLTREIRAAATKASQPGFLSLWAGQAAALGRELPARELVAQIVREADAVLSQL